MAARLKRYLDDFFYIFKARRKLGPDFFMVGSNTGGNMGDSAILLAEKKFMESMDLSFKEVTFEEMYDKYFKIYNHVLRASDTILYQGGGNMGNIWYHEEYYRRKLIQKHPDNEIIIFPQTIFFTDSADAEDRKRESIDIYNRPNITIVAREKISYEIFTELYPKANILLTPDIVLSLPAYRFKQNRDGILLCMRRDYEKIFSSEAESKLISVIKGMDIDYSYTDTCIEDNSYTVTQREDVVTAKFRELASAELVITDRLHGMVFCAITETPCIVLSNFNQKVKGTYEWIKYLDYIRYVDTVEEAIGLIPDLMKMKNCRYDNSRLLPLYEPLREIIRAQVRK